MTTLFFDPTEYLAREEVRLLSASLSFPDQVPGVVRSDSCTDAEGLAALTELLTSGSDPTYPPGCPFGGVLTLQLEEGGEPRTLTLTLSSGSCSVFTLHGLSFYDYGGQEKLLAIFPNCQSGR